MSSVNMNLCSSIFKKKMTHIYATPGLKKKMHVYVLKASSRESSVIVHKPLSKQNKFASTKKYYFSEIIFLVNWDIVFI